LDELRGVPYASWYRESTEEQYDRYGPASQRDSIRTFADRYGLVDSGLEFVAAQSGRTVWKSPVMTEMLTAAHSGAFGALLIGYYDRWQRNLRRTLELIEDDLHPSGVVWVMCDRRLVSGDPRDWDEMIREAHEAERYSRRLGERITDGYASKFRAYSDQAGNAPRGFRRVADGPPGHERSLLSIDAESMERVVAAFARYAIGDVSIGQLARESGWHPDAVQEMLSNPIYNGWVRRHRRTPAEELRPAPWRNQPPVDDTLWAQVQEVLRVRRRGGGTAFGARRVFLLARRLVCVCGRPLKGVTNVQQLKGIHYEYRRYQHPEPCGSRKSWRASNFEDVIAAQVRGMKLDGTLLARLRALAAHPNTRPEPWALRRRQIEHELASRAQLHAQRRSTTEAYLAEHARLSRQLDALTEPASETGVIDPDRAIGWLSNIKKLWAAMDAEGRRDLAAAIYQRVTVKDGVIQQVELTPSAYAHGAALALPDRVLVTVARPAGFEPAT
jgi:hypothetical protein